MDTSRRVHRMTIAAVLCAIGMIIPIISPVKIPLGMLGSFTLASHVAIFIAIFISPTTAVSVSIATAFGFLLTPIGTPEVMARALSHIIFAIIGALIIKKNPNILKSLWKVLIFSLLIACLHAVCEMLVVIPFFFGNPAKMEKGFVTSILMLVGAVTVIHSLVDFFLALLIWKPLSKMKSLTDVPSKPKTA